MEADGAAHAIARAWCRRVSGFPGVAGPRVVFVSGAARKIGVVAVVFLVLAGSNRHCVGGVWPATARMRGAAEAGAACVDRGKMRHAPRIGGQAANGFLGLFGRLLSLDVVVLWGAQFEGAEGGGPCLSKRRLQGAGRHSPTLRCCLAECRGKTKNATPMQRRRGGARGHASVRGRCGPHAGAERGHVGGGPRAASAMRGAPPAGWACARPLKRHSQSP